MSIKSMQTILYTLESQITFYRDKHHYLCYKIKDKDIEYEPLCEDRVVEYDVDLDPQGNIGLVCVDQKGKFNYYYFDGQSWTVQLLYQLDLELENIFNISIKYSRTTPYIFFCWNSIAEPNQISLVSYYRYENLWKKEIVHRSHIREKQNLYKVIKDSSYNLYLVFLTNNNLIYDIYLKVLKADEIEWHEPIFLSNCLYIKNLSLDLLSDDEDKIHLIWTDKHKNNYCIKYALIDHHLYQLVYNDILFKNPTPILESHLYMKDGYICCLSILDNEIIVFSTLDNNSHENKWAHTQILEYDGADIKLIRIVQDCTSNLIDFKVNFVISWGLKDEIPMFYYTLHDKTKINTKNLFIQYAEEKKDNIEVTAPLKEKKNINKNEKKDMTKERFKPIGGQNLVALLEREIAYLKEEFKKVSDQNKKYLLIIGDSGEKNKTFKDQIKKLENDIQHNQAELEIVLNQHHEFQEEYKKVQTLIEEYLNEITLLKEQINALKEENLSLNQENELLKEEIAKEKEAGFFKKIFNS